MYYYFENKQAVVDAVLDDYVEDLVESVIVWNESRRFGDTSGSLRACIATFRRALYDAEGNQRPMIAVLEELGVRDAFDVRAVRETVDCINGNIVAEYAAYHQVEIEFVYEMFCVVVFGLVGLVKINPAISDEALMKVVEQALHLDMEPLDAPDEIRHPNPPAATCEASRLARALPGRVIVITDALTVERLAFICFDLVLYRARRRIPDREGGLTNERIHARP